MTEAGGDETPRTRRRRSRTRVVALTGVHGAVGAALVRRLDEDERVSRLVLIDRRAPAVPFRKAVFFGCDLTATLADAALAETLARERVETVVHAAFHECPSGNPEQAHELEVIGTQALLRAVADNGRRAGTVTNVVVVGSTMSYGAQPDNPQYLDEDAPLRGAAGYPFVADKIAVEESVAGFARSSGIPTALLRRAWTLGDRTTFAARMLASRMVPTVLGADPLVQLLELDDLVDAVRLAAHRRYDGILNVAGEGVLPLSTLVTLAGGVRVPALEPVVRAGLHALWAVGVGLVPGAHAAYLRHPCVADTGRARDALGFRARFGTREALARHRAGCRRAA